MAVFRTASPQCIWLEVAADVSRAMRANWLERLWQAIQDDDMPYLEHLGQFWGELCVTPEMAAKWADELTSPRHHHVGTQRGRSAWLFQVHHRVPERAAGRIDQLLALLDIPRHKHWHDRQWGAEWGAEALVRIGRHAEAVAYAENSLSINTPFTSTPGQEEKWFAAAKASGLFALATELAQRNLADPRTLIRAAKDTTPSNNRSLRWRPAPMRWVASPAGGRL